MVKSSLGTFPSNFDFWFQDHNNHPSRASFIIGKAYFTVSTLLADFMIPLPLSGGMSFKKLLSPFVNKLLVAMDTDNVIM